MKNGRLQIGIIGCGETAETKILPLLREEDSICEPAAFYDPDKERRRQAKERYGSPETKEYESYRDLLQDPEIDAVQITTIKNGEMILEALEAGKHVMCESPMASSPQEAQQIFNAWKKSGKKLAVRCISPFRPEAEALQKICADGDLGELFLAETYALSQDGNLPQSRDPIAENSWPMEKVEWETVNLAFWLLGTYEVKSVSSVIYTVSDEARYPNQQDPSRNKPQNTILGLIRMQNGMTIFLKIEKDQEPYKKNPIRCTIHGSFGTVELSDFDTEKDMGQPGRTQIRQWLDTILEGTRPDVEPEQCFAAIKVMDAIAKSARNGKEIIF